MESFTILPLNWKNAFAKMTILPIQISIYEIGNGIFHRTRTKLFTICIKHKRPQIHKGILRKKNKLEELTFLTSEYTTKLQSSRQYSTGTKTEI